MKRNIAIVLVLMSFCVIVITALQFYYSYTNYNASAIAFKKDSNEAFKEAVDSTLAGHRRKAIMAGKEWLMDTTKISITVQRKKDNKQTTFVLKEGDRELFYAITSPKIPLIVDSITPKIKAIIADNIMSTVEDQLRINSMFFFTEGLGERIKHTYYDTPIDKSDVEEYYRQALKRRDIELPFSLNCENGKEVFRTKKMNISVSNKSHWVYACFENTDAYLLGRLKWIVGSTLLLILITLGCFWYTLKTLFNQEKFSRLKDDFINNMTHEIHSPLSSVIITAEAMKKFDMNQQERESYIDIILHQSKKLGALADDILVGAKLDKKGIELKDTIELKLFIGDIMSGYKNEAVLNYSIDNDIRFKGNKDHLSRAIINIIDNALKYNEEKEVQVNIQGNVEDNEVIITIADNGQGVPDAYKEKIFEEFYRISTGNVHNVKGYGLGLSYVKKVIQAHKGSIVVKDNAPVGSIFVIRIPYEA